MDEFLEKMMTTDRRKTAKNFMAILPLTAMLASPVMAVETNVIRQLTNVTNEQSAYIDHSRYPDISPDGSAVVFHSQADLIPGSNPSHVDNLFIMNPDGTNMRQLTFIEPNMGYARAPRLSRDGSRVVFTSSADLAGENPPEVVDFGYYTQEYRNAQIFIMNADGTSIKQLTKGLGGNSVAPQISDNGEIIVFQSNQDLTGENADATDEIFVIFADGTNLMQVTVGTPKPPELNKRSDASRDPSISGDGSTLAWDSFIDLVPPQNDDRSDEIFTFDLAGYMANGGNRADYTTQITDTDIDAPHRIRAEDAFEPVLSYDGSQIVFSACINPGYDPETGEPGLNPYLPDVIFVAKSDGTDYRQLTFGDDIDDDYHWPQITDDGQYVVFGSRAQEGVNTHRSYDIWAARVDGTWAEQLTFGNDSVGRVRPSINSDGSIIVFHSENDYAGQNADGNKEIFSITNVAYPTPPVPVTPPSDDEDAEEYDGDERDEEEEGDDRDDDRDRDERDDEEDRDEKDEEKDRDERDDKDEKKDNKDNKSKDDKKNKNRSVEASSENSGGIGAFDPTSALILALFGGLLALRKRGQTRAC